LDGRGTAVFGQQRGMDVKAAKTRKVQKLLGKDLAVGGDGDEVRVQGAELQEEIRAAGALGLQNGEVGAEGEFFDRGRLDSKVTAFGAVGLGNDGLNLEGGTGG